MKMKAKIYTAPSCVWCTKAKELLANHNIPFEEITVGKDMLKEEFLAFFKEAGVTSVPQIYIDGNFIGGYVNLTKHLGYE